MNKVTRMTNRKSQGCGLGLDVSVSRPSRDVLTSRLGLISVSDLFVSSRRFVRRRAVHDFSSPILTSMT